MKNRLLPFRTLLLTFRLDQFILPAAVWALFVIVAWFMHDEPQVASIATGYLGFTLPLLSGILAANAVLDDPALEVSMSTPRPAWLILLERLGLILAFQAVTALLFQAVMAALGVDLSHLGSFWGRQLAWLIPCLGMLALGNAMSFIAANCVGGALITGSIWIIQTIAHSWMADSSWARYIYFFLTADCPDHPSLLANQACILGLTAALLLAAWMLFRKQERYL